MTHHHRSLREHLEELAERGHEPEFTPTTLPPLVAFADLFDSAEVYSFDVNRWLPADGLVTSWELTAEVRATADSEPVASTASWEPVAGDPRAGFGLGTSSVLWGGAPDAPLPDDLRTRAFLLLVTTDFEHLSASREQDPPLVRGAINGPGEGFEYVQLAR